MTSKPGSDVQVISLSLEAQNIAPRIDAILSPKKLNTTALWIRYGASKAANVLFAAELARRYPLLTSVSLHPGMDKTDLWKYDEKSHSVIRYFTSVSSGFIYKNLQQDAYSQLYLATGAEKNALQNGRYYTPVGNAKPNKTRAGFIGGEMAVGVDGERMEQGWTLKSVI